MPVALERKLKREVAGKKMSKDRKDAYVYGTLRKTGWKPSREKKKELSARLDRLIQFENENVRRARNVAADIPEHRQKLGQELLGGAAGIGVGTPAGIFATGGLARLSLGRLIESEHPERWARGIAYGGMATGIGAGMLTARTIRRSFDKDRLRKEQGFSSMNKPIQFGAEILGPWQGNTGHTSKIDQLEFPSSLSPAAALQFPLPVLMRYLNQRNILQQQFSWKHQRLIELSAKLDEIHASTHPTK